MKHLFIVNPVAGKGRGSVYVEVIKGIMGNQKDYIIEVTKHSGHATQIAKQYTSKEDYIVYAVGGDGTINEVVNGMVGSKSILAIVPTGSGNDFIRTIYPPYSQKTLIHRLLEGKTISVDLMQINHKYFLNIASVGLDAEIAFHASAFKKIKFIKGEVAYILSLFRTLLTYKSQRLKVSLDGEEVCNKKILLLAMANGRFYGGGIQIAPRAKIDDAKVDICMVRELKLSKILPLILKLFKAQHEAADEVEVYRARHMKIEGIDHFRVNIDGEIIEADQVTMEVVEKAIQVMIPAS